MQEHYQRKKVRYSLCKQIGHEIELVLVRGRDVIDGQIVEEQVELGAFVSLKNTEEIRD